MMRVAIISQDGTLIEQVKHCSEIFARDNNLDLPCKVFCGCMEFLSQDNVSFDCVFIDDNVSDMDVYKFIAFIGEKDKCLFTVMIGTHTESALKAYKVQTKGFLAKPVRKEDIEALLERFTKFIDRPSLSVNNSNGAYRIPVNDILYVETYKHNLIIHSLDGNIKYWGTMKHICETLTEERGFIMCNVGYLVNLKQVGGVTGDYVLVGDEKLKISRGKKSTFMQKMQYFIST